MGGYYVQTTGARQEDSIYPLSIQITYHSSYLKTIYIIPKYLKWVQKRNLLRHILKQEQNVKEQRSG